MNKFPFVLLTLAFIVSACGTAAEAPTNAPAVTQAAAATQAALNGAGTPAITQQVGALVLASPTANANTKSVVTPPAAGGGPVVITVEPANGTPQAEGTTVPALAPTPIPTLSAGLSPSELKFHLLAAFPDFFFCDPDVYPVARADQTQMAEERFPSIQANAEEYQAILHNANLPASTLNSDQKLIVYQAHKKLAAIRFTLTGDKYQFQLVTKDASGKGLLITGLIDGQGAISNQQSQPTVATCPI